MQRVMQLVQNNPQLQQQMQQTLGELQRNPEMARQLLGSLPPGAHPTRTPAMGFLSGTSEMAATALAAVMASASVERTPS